MRLKIWWAKWRETTRNLFFELASLASMAGLLFAFDPPADGLPWWGIALLVGALVFFVTLVVMELASHRNRHAYAKSDIEKIRTYMHRWIEHGGRVAIWTRDMSWADNSETRRLLTEKAKRSELILCLPERNPLVSSLEAAGAEVCAYGRDVLEAPASRFTIAFFGRDGARVAVGRADGDIHVIDEFGAAMHPAFHLAGDLVALVRAKRGLEAR